MVGERDGGEDAGSKDEAQIVALLTTALPPDAGAGLTVTLVAAAAASWCRQS